jgi:hypothetical protein
MSDQKPSEDSRSNPDDLFGKGSLPPIPPPRIRNEPTPTDRPPSTSGADTSPRPSKPKPRK